MMMQEEQRFAKLVSECHFHDSIADRGRVRPESIQSCVQAFSCHQCDARFGTERALKSHCRAKHGDRLGIRNYLSSAVCPACQTDFRDRLRCLAHVSDRRRPRCRDYILANCRPVADQELLAHLDAQDRLLRRLGRRDGRFHHIARDPARTADGRIVGRVG